MAKFAKVSFRQTFWLCGSLRVGLGHPQTTGEYYILTYDLRAIYTVFEATQDHNIYATVLCHRVARSWGCLPSTVYVHTLLIVATIIPSSKLQLFNLQHVLVYTVCRSVFKCWPLGMISGWIMCRVFVWC